jgi:hypothetical protein
LWRPY